MAGDAGEAGNATKRPGGRGPESIVLDAVPVAVQTPPLVTSCWPYEAPTEAGGRQLVTIASGVPACACRKEAAAQRPTTANIPRVYLPVITYHSPFARCAPDRVGRNDTDLSESRPDPYRRSSLPAN